MIKQDQETLLVYFMAFMELSQELEKEIGDDVAFVFEKTIEDGKKKVNKLTQKQRSNLLSFAKESLTDLSTDATWDMWTGGIHNSN
jgi:fructose-1,6-bisphosphatase